MDPDQPNPRARNLIATYDLTDAEVRQIVAVARLHLATFDPAYRANVSQLAVDLKRSRPTLYHWADQALAATVSALRAVRMGRPPRHPLGRSTTRSTPEAARRRDAVAGDAAGRH